jgi:hypothetical protein
MSLSRRQFIQASGIALCAGAMPLTANAAGQQHRCPFPVTGIPSRAAAIPDVTA